jgi:conjugal transfer pilus assembly protein TraB
MGGAGSALHLVAQHYLKMAEKLFPIIEIDAGRTVEIVVLKGQELKIAGTRTKQVATKNR